MRRYLVMAATAALMTAPAVHAQTPAPACAAPVPAPPAWGAWDHPAAVTTAGAEIAKAPELTLGQATTAQLTVNPQMTYAVPLYKPAADNTYGGLFTFTVAKAGVYTIGLDGKAWIDVAKGGQTYKSVAHAEGAACSSLHKTVDFQLEPGTYSLQLSVAAKPAIEIEIIAKP